MLSLVKLVRGHWPGGEVKIMYKVQKKDGTLEDFDPNKILSGVKKAGGSEEDAQKVLSEIQAWLPTAAQNNVVKVLDIRTKGLEILRSINPEVAASFESYQKSTKN